MGKWAHSHLYSPHPCPGQETLNLLGASEGTIAVPDSQPGPTAADSGRLIMLEGIEEMEQLDLTRPQRGPKSGPLILPPLGAEEVLCRSRSEGRNTW